jgi:hypothetical protein
MAVDRKYVVGSLKDCLGQTPEVIPYWNVY